MLLASLINVLNARYGMAGVRYIEVNEWQRAFLPKSRRPNFDGEIVFRVGRKIYRITCEYSHDPYKFECSEKREWADSKKPSEWIENEFTRDLHGYLSQLKFDEDGFLSEESFAQLELVSGVPNS